MIALEADRDDWSTSIRNAKSSQLVSLNVTHPNSTLTSSSSTAHIRRSLQALPYAPSDHRLGTIREQSQPSSKIHGRGTSKEDIRRNSERRAVVEHWVPAIWIPDGKTDECMRCGKEFGWRRRRHHCRLCGRCVCHACSSRVSSLFHLQVVRDYMTHGCRHFIYQIQGQKVPPNLLERAKLVTRLCSPFLIHRQIVWLRLQVPTRHHLFRRRQYRHLQISPLGRRYLGRQ
jgi:hypothetical protein